MDSLTILKKAVTKAKERMSKSITNLNDEDFFTQPAHFLFKDTKRKIHIEYYYV